MSVAVHPSPLPRRRTPPIAVLATLALVTVGALIATAFFFTAGMLFLPLVLAGAVLFGIWSHRRRENPPAGTPTEPDRNSTIPPQPPIA